MIDVTTYPNKIITSHFINLLIPVVFDDNFSVTDIVYVCLWCINVATQLYRIR
jgi:hypothetical protein